MNIKYYRVTKDQIYRYFYSLEWDEQMTVNYQFGEKAKNARLTILDYIFHLIDIGEFRYRGVKVKLKNRLENC